MLWSCANPIDAGFEAFSEALYLWINQDIVVIAGDLMHIEAGD